MFRWILVGWMFVVSAIAYLDRVNLSIAGRAIEEEFHLTDIQLGYVLSAFVLGYALFQAPGGRIADRFGPRLVLALGERIEDAEGSGRARAKARRALLQSLRAQI